MIPQVQLQLMPHRKVISREEEWRGLGNDVMVEHFVTNALFDHKLNGLFFPEWPCPSNRTTKA